MNQWLAALGDILANGDRAMLVTIAGVRGSAPRETGAKMIVTEKETIGSIGGGQLEYLCAKKAFDLLRSDKISEHVLCRYPLGSAFGQCCGGIVDVLFEDSSAIDAHLLPTMMGLYEMRKSFVIVTSSDRKVLLTKDACAVQLPSVVAEQAVAMLANGSSTIALQVEGASYLLEPVRECGFSVAVFGAGHVGTAVVATLATLNCNIRWIDSRRNMMPAQVNERILSIETAHPEAEVTAMPADACYLVLTHSHPLDFAICARILARDDVAYCGLIGSRTKRRRFERLMRSQGMAQLALDKLHCPIGIDGIGGKTPAEIAIAVTAEILQIRASQIAQGGVVETLRAV